MKDTQAWYKQQETIADLHQEGFKQIEKSYTLVDKKLNLFERIVSEHNINIEALKTFALSTDLHLEASLPL